MKEFGLGFSREDKDIGSGKPLGLSNRDQLRVLGAFISVLKASTKDLKA